MHIWPDKNIERRGGRIASMEVSYARLVETFGEPNVSAGELDADKVSAQWLLATNEGPASIYNWLPETHYLPPETTTQWHIGGSRTEVVSCVAEHSTFPRTSTGGTRSRNGSVKPRCLSVTESERCVQRISLR